MQNSTPMHPEDIKAAIRKRGYTLAKVAESVATADAPAPSKSAVSRVLRGEFKSARIASHIARLIGVPPSQLWPGMYPGLEQAPAHRAPKPTARPKTTA